MTDADKRSLIIAIATKEGTARQISEQYGYSVPFLREFTKDNLAEIKAVHEAIVSREDTQDEEGEPTPSELSNLWIGKKGERLKCYQRVADELYKEIKAGSRDATTLREFRFYMQAVANELGQLLHRGAGESGSDSLSVDMQGVELDNLR